MVARKLSRRRFFADAGKLVAGAALGAGIVGVGSRSVIQGRADEVPQWPWPYVELDPEAVAARAYEVFPGRHCMYAPFEAIIGELREKVGYPYTVMPTNMMEYGKAGVVGWGTLCGALNGASAVITLVTEDYAGVVSELMGWYTETALPMYKPSDPEVEIETTSISGSPICHVSVTKWCNASGFGSKSPERKERCRRLAADVAAKAAELLNQVTAGTFAPAWAAPASVDECLACHGPGKSVDNVFGKMDCLQCHERHY